MFFFSSRRRHTRCLSDWSSDVCSSDLQASGGALRAGSDALYPIAFRELGRRGLAGMPILLVLTDLVIGRQADDHPKVWQEMVPPEIFRKQVADRVVVNARRL